MFCDSIEHHQFAYQMIKKVFPAVLFIINLPGNVRNALLIGRQMVAMSSQCSPVYNMISIIASNRNLW